LTEYDANGTVLFHTYFDAGNLGVGVENYRGFRYNWTGLPNEEPALVALENDKGTTIYVSWNGDTETKVWRFFAVGDRNKRQYLGETKRSSFETSFHVPRKSVKSVFAEAISSKGEVFRSTKVASLQPEVLQAKGGTKAEPVVIQEQATVEL
jgi:hypothetical protein